MLNAPSNSLLSHTLRLPCGATLPNRLAKSAMTEGLADPLLRATARHERLYRQWSEGGAGLLVTGNVLIDRRVLERPGNVAIDVTDPRSVAPEARVALQRWSAAGTSAGNQLWMQISHAGRQSPRYVTLRPTAPSDVQLDLLGNYGRPRALREDEILDLIRRFAGVAVIARETGFTGVQIHSAHGYLLSAFLSPISNQRRDAWGGSLENRSRFLLEAIRATRKAVGADFPIAIKLNSDDFRKGGFTNEECVQLVQTLNGESLDLLEISGGTYEQPKLLGFTGRESSAAPQRESTQKREAYFLDYAAKIRAVATMPLMVTGGFRTREGMAATLAAGECDVIGLARPLCTEADVPRRLIAGTLAVAPSFEKQLVMSQAGLFSPTSKVLLFKLVNVLGGQGWYYQQIARMSDGLAPDLGRGVLKAFFLYWIDELKTALKMHLAR